MSEQREYPRVSAQSKLKYKVVEGEGPDTSAAGVATNISGGGICFVMDEPIPDGTLLALELTLPGFPSDVIALARVVWQRKRADKRLDTGCEFHWVGWDSTQAQQRVADFIRHRLDD